MAGRIEANLRQIMLHEAKPCPKAMASTTVTRGFEAVAYPKIVRELSDEQLVVRQKALMAARELLGSPTGHIQCIAAGITPACIALLSDADATVRERAAGTLEYVMAKEVGARDAIQHCGVSKLVTCLSDSDRQVRDAAYQALIEGARFDCLRKELCSQKALVHLLKLALLKDHLLKGLIVLNACVQVRHNEDALTQLIDDGGAIPALSDLLAESHPEAVQEQVAQLLGLITSRFADARETAVKVGAVPRLVSLLSSPSVHVASAASTALMTMTIAREGKYAVLEGPEGLAPLIPLLNPHRTQLCINAMQLITNCCEMPEARPILVESGVVQALQKVFEFPSASDLLKNSAAHALRQLGFKHLPYEVLPGKKIVSDQYGCVRSLPIEECA